MCLLDSRNGETVKTSWLASVGSGASTDVLMKVENCSKDLTWCSKKNLGTFEGIWKRRIEPLR